MTDEPAGALRRRLLDLAAAVHAAPDDEAALEVMRAATGLSMTDVDADRAELRRRAESARRAAGETR